MEKFQVHFFREKTRDLDVEALLAFFEVIEGMEIEMDERSVRINYKHPRLGYKACFLIMPKSQVKDIYRLNPRYLDLNFQLELPLTVPDYFADHVFHIVKRLVEKFDYFVYQDYFEDVLPFRLDLVMKIFNMVKERYLELHPKFLQENYLISKDKLNSVLRYMDDNFSLQKYYQEASTYVPFYLFLANADNRLRIGFEWKYDTLTVIPPYVDFIFLNRGNDVSIIKYQEFYEQASKFLDDVPGFLKDSKVVSKKNLKKVNKILKKNKFTKVIEVLTKVDHFQLID
ncbi:hypothetical protein [Haploplasma axanthum]|uniref:Uncharacterized protein n=1 Tax=Haploplasma axanthum TaxID=29552 RepID=A0A449BEE1_HAPAX|nr:hypothetical protein [Haploplasma axanthum]VEU80823.1 Uncharacterised protein [Haploplasma axanthum]